MHNLYGIKNCDTMKKAIKWLNDNSISFHFHDYKKEGIDADTLALWLQSTSWDQLINRRGTTWRKLADELKVDIDTEKAINLMIENTSLIKRPILQVDKDLHLGFEAENYAKIFNK